jgi:hypothetical protein
MGLFHDLLKVDDAEKNGSEKYSQARVYLFASVVMYFITIMLYLSHAFFNIVSDVNVLVTIMNSLQTMMLLFASYSLVGKGMSTTTINKRLEGHAKFMPTATQIDTNNSNRSTKTENFDRNDRNNDTRTSSNRPPPNNNRNRNNDLASAPRRFDDEEGGQELA